MKPHIKVTSSDGQDFWCDITSDGDVFFYIDENLESTSSATFHVSDLDRINHIAETWRKKQEK